jgi:hypothetical protein
MLGPSDQTKRLTALHAIINRPFSVRKTGVCPEIVVDQGIQGALIASKKLPELFALHSDPGSLRKQDGPVQHVRGLDLIDVSRPMN